MRAKGIVRRGVVAALWMSTAVAIIGMATPALSQHAESKSFTIRPQSLQNALVVFGQQAGMQVSVDASALRGLTSAGVSGSLTPQAALTRLLTGSGLENKFAGPKTVLIAKPGIQASGLNAEGTTVLNTITVQGSGNQTEGSNLYTIESMNSATGLALSPRETPQSISVITQQRVKDTNAQNITDVLKSSPGIFVDETDGYRSEPYARGFYIDRFQYDGVTINVQNGWHGEHSNESAFYDHAEIVRGSTGLMTGAGNPSASINFVRKRADSKTPHGSITASAGSWDNYRTILDYSSPLNKEGTVRGRVIGVLQNKEAFFDREHMKRGAIYGTAEIDVSEDTLVTIGADYQKRDTDGAQWGGIPAMMSNGQPANLPRSFSTSTDWTYYKAETWNVFGRLDHEFDNGWKLRADALQRGSNYDMKGNFPRGVLNPDGSGISFAPSYMIADAEQRVLNLNLSGDFELFERQHEFTAGLTSDYAKQNYYFRSRKSLTPIANLFDWNGSMAEPEWTNPYYYLTETKQQAAYVATRLSLYDGLHAIVGSRFTKWEQNTYGTIATGSEVIPYVGLTYDLTDNLTVYASYTDIFAPQTNLDRYGNFLDPKTGKSYEIGLKGEFLDGRLNASAAIFRTLQDNVAVADTGHYVPGTSSQAYIGAKGVETQGIEAEIGGEIAYGWNAWLSGTYMESKDADGVRVNPQIPRATAGLFTTYDLKDRLDGLTLGGGVRWQGGTSRPISTGTETVDFKQSGFATVDLLTRYKFTDSMEAQLNVNNVFDKKYSRLTEDGLLFYGAPRNFNLTLTAKF
ncbi:TonB-dependent siderophore receptor [Ochrobactrum sp. EDr1-4]|uniref:TonB-dependent siderophore receptor n=1 Tax=Ochrobactrum sp. EDr1-4 TaxID=3368622 RepID=UPI003BA3D7D0